jgi:hypothetical protein
MDSETIPELLTRLEREHVPCEEPFGEAHCAGCEYDGCDSDWPCSTARVVAHARSLEAALRWWLCDEHKTEKVAMGDHCLNQDCQYARIPVRAALGEAQ